MGKIILIVVLSLLVLWNIILTAIIVKANKVYIYSQDISNHNDEVFKEALKEHVNTINKIGDSLSSIEDDLNLMKNQINDNKRETKLDIERLNMQVDSVVLIIKALESNGGH